MKLIITVCSLIILISTFIQSRSTLEAHEESVEDLTPLNLQVNNGYTELTRKTRSFCCRGFGGGKFYGFGGKKYGRGGYYRGHPKYTVNYYPVGGNYWKRPNYGGHYNPGYGYHQRPGGYGGYGGSRASATASASAHAYSYGK